MVIRPLEIMRPENCSKVWLNTFCRWSAAITAWSSVSPSSASSPRCEMPWVRLLSLVGEETVEAGFMIALRGECRRGRDQHGAGDGGGETLALTFDIVGTCC